MKSTVLFTLSLLVAEACLFCKTAYPGENPPQKITLAYPSFGPSMMWFLLEKDLGYFRQEGFTLEAILVRSDIAAKGLIAGNFDYVQTAGTVLSAVIRARQPLKVVFTAGTAHFWLVALPDIHSVEDLKGKTIAISSRGSNTDLIVQEIFKRHSLDPLRHATFLTAGAARERFAALTSRAVSATPLSAPFSFKAVEMGFKKIASAQDYIQWPQGGLGITEDKIRHNPQEVTKIVRASLKGLKFALTQSDYVIGKMMQLFRVNRQEASQTYEVLREEFVPSGFLSREAERKIISLLKEAANAVEDIPPESVFDNRFVIEAEGELKNWRPQTPK
jgi:NitT/TauT family transport system substrate-binding protein